MQIFTVASNLTDIILENYINFFGNIKLARNVEEVSI